ncbi:hypothetical protein ABZ470_28895 [Streptosporangium sp. NPDC020072]|uniref:Secreted protein n=1 Tax=Streptosporangium jomthongense TaxID=1193683 RepID=A0ABV8F4A3_9ACTN
MRTRIRAALLGGIASAAFGAALLAAPAANADWNGTCAISYYQQSGTGHATGWCGGTGPEKYQIGVKCANGLWYWSLFAKDFGDTTGLTADCPTGYAAVGYDWRRF